MNEYEFRYVKGKELGVKVPDFDFACKEMRTYE